MGDTWIPTSGHGSLSLNRGHWQVELDKEDINVRTASGTAALSLDHLHSMAAHSLADHDKPGKGWNGIRTMYNLYASEEMRVLFVVSLFVDVRSVSTGLKSRAEVRGSYPTKPFLL